MNPTFFAIELKRIVRDVTTMFFVAILPAVLYLIFGANQSYGDNSVGNGNVAFYVMIGMAAYGAVTATVGVGGMAAVEQMQGWGRQLGLTPMSDAQRVVTRAAVGFVVAIVPVGLIYALGAVTGAEAEPQVWLISGLVVLLGSAVFSFFGLLSGLLFRSEAAVSAASGSLVIFAFLGNLYFPLTGLLLDIARFTPLYGYVALARYPLTDGWTVRQSPEDESVLEPLWVPTLNLGLWAVVFIAATLLVARRGRARQ
ncbi:ABC transporter permease [Microbacterium sp. Marseille-Q6965]|uniref:ABC transporter permease n=1 Tax=Microbacterium sp. Marseille-Q6965 TaxID=2965072 RepID=UPI0021B7BC05|nr:ABC transporter permease [Microbacterium sp. Marseille-Q6965]